MTHRLFSYPPVQCSAHSPGGWYATVSCPGRSLHCPQQPHRILPPAPSPQLRPAHPLLLSCGCAPQQYIGTIRIERRHFRRRKQKAGIGPTARLLPCPRPQPTKFRVSCLHRQQRWQAESPRRAFRRTDTHDTVTRPRFRKSPHGERQPTVPQKHTRCFAPHSVGWAGRRTSGTRRSIIRPVGMPAADRQYRNERSAADTSAAERKRTNRLPGR